MAYSDKVIDHYENPRNVGGFDKGDDSVGTGVGLVAGRDVAQLGGSGGGIAPRQFDDGRRRRGRWLCLALAHPRRVSRRRATG